VIAACCERAIAAGVRVGMALSDAGAILRGGVARVMESSSRRDRAALRRLAERLMRFSPVVSADPPDGVLLDIAGCAHLFGGEREMRRRVCRWLARRGLAARVSVAPTIGCAWAVARFAEEESLIVPERGERAAMAPLPIASLRLSRESLAGFGELSIENVGEFMALPRALAPSRFGPEAIRRLDEALGGAHEWAEALRPLEPVRAECVFEGPTTRLDAVAHATRGVIDQIVGSLRDRSCGVTRLDLEHVRADLPPECRSIVLTRPSTDATHLWKLIAPRLERLHMGFGVTGVRALAAGVAPMRAVQASLRRSVPGERDSRGVDEQEQAFAELMDALTNRVGAERALRVELVESHIPERGVRWRSVLDPASDEDHTRGQSDRRAPGPERPSILFDQPEPARAIVLCPDGPIHRLSWRSHEHEVTACIGPERIEHEWWRHSGAGDGARDYFRVQSGGGVWLWLFRERSTSRWFVHGVWA